MIRDFYKKRKGNAAGSAVVLQSGGPTAVINASLIGIAEAWQEMNDGKLFGALYGVKGLIDGNLVLLYPRNDFQKLRSVNYSPSAALGSSRHSLRDKSGKSKENELLEIFSVLKRQNIKFVFLIGGEDSRENAHTISLFARSQQIDISVAHIPKTIDNDLTLTHHSPGFGSASQFLINAVAGLELENRAMKGILIDVAMGRNSGWLAASASVAKLCFASVPEDFERQHYLAVNHCEESFGPHLVYLPEVNFQKEKFLADIFDVEKKYGRAHVVVSEGIAEHKEVKNYSRKLFGEEFLTAMCGSDDFGHPQINGDMLGLVLCHLARTGLKNSHRVRSETFGHLQRSFPMFSEADSQQAFDCGEYAVRQARTGREKFIAVVLGKEHSLCNSSKVSHANLDDAFKDGRPKIKTFPQELIENGNQISTTFRDYIGIGDRGSAALVTIPNFRVIDFEKMSAK